MAESRRSSTDMSPGGQEGLDTRHGFQFSRGRASRELHCDVPDLLQSRVDLSWVMILSSRLLNTGVLAFSSWVKKNVILRTVPLSYCVCLQLLPAGTDADSVCSMPGSEKSVLVIHELL